ncbi:hypothetical protein DQ539_20895 [Salmonella enterica]|nr:hypothetical protein [Salmonella enterica]
MEVNNSDVPMIDCALSVLDTTMQQNMVIQGLKIYEFQHQFQKYRFYNGINGTPVHGMNQ